MKYIGIDPGREGGISIIDRNKKIFYSMEMPISKDKDIDIKSLLKLIEVGDHYFCVIEKAQSMPRQGVVSVFSYARDYGQVLAFLKILHISFLEVPPRTWKNEFLLDNKKYKSIIMAEKLFPGETFLTSRMRYMDGKAESLLIAEYARRLGGKNKK